MKRNIFSIFVCFLLLIFYCNSVSAAAKVMEKPNVKIYINGKLEKFKDIITINGQPLLPYEELLINLGVTNDAKHIVMNEKEKSIKAIKDKVEIYLKIGDANAILNGVKTKMEVASTNYKGKIYLPVRFICESLNKNVTWDEKAGKLLIIEKTEADRIKDIISKADMVLKKSKYMVEEQKSASESSGLESKFNSNDKIQIDNVKKISYVYTKYLNNEGIEKVIEMLIYNKTFYAKFSFNNSWGKTAISDKDLEWYLNTWRCLLQTNFLDGISYSNLKIAEDSQKGEYLIRGKIKDSIDHNELGERDTYIKIVIDKSTYQCKEVIIEAVQRADTSKKIEYHFTYSEYDGSYEVYIPDGLPQ